METVLNLFKSIISNAQVILIALAIGITVGASGALYTKAKFEKADKVDAVVSQRKADVHELADSQRKDGALKGSLDTTRTNAGKNTAAIGHTVYVKVRVKVPTKCPEISNVKSNAQTENSFVQSPVDNSDIFLTNGDVRLLNNIRADLAPDTASNSDGKGQAPSDVTVKDFIDNDSEVAQQYNELAKKHDVLVDYVADLVKKQNDKILSGK